MHDDEFEAIRKLMRLKRHETPGEGFTEDFLKDAFNTNVISGMMLSSLAVPLLEPTQGAIIFIGSVHNRRAFPGASPYATTKAAIEGLTRSLARDLGSLRIRVNTLIPGWVMTERQMALWLDAEGEAEIQRRQCLKDKVQPADIARMVLFLAADDSRMCTAQNFIVDAGWI